MNVGLFWDELPDVKKKIKPLQRRLIPAIPETGWRPPLEFPNLDAAKVIGIDTETFDPELTESGPGWGRGKGHIIGVSLSVEDGTSWYFPIRHGFDDGKQVLPPYESSMNLDVDKTFSFLSHTLNNNKPKVGANLIYDLGWLLREGVDIKGPFFDIQFAEALLDSETPRVDLDSLGEKYLNKGKTTNLLYEFLSVWCGGAVNEKQRKNLYIAPPSLVGPYAEDDASLPIQILSKQWPKMYDRGVLDVFYLECKLIPLLVEMRMKGAPINLGTAEETHYKFGLRLQEIEKNIIRIAGQNVNPNAPDSIAKAFTSLGIPHPTKIHKETKETVISFDANRLESVDHPLVNEILNWRKLSKVRDVFIGSYLLDKHVNSRIYCSFNPLKGSEGGTRSGRFSSNYPNLQNIPVRTEEGRLVRKIFDASVNGGRWRSFDYSSIEYRLLVHFAVGKGSDEVREQFRIDPHTDYHDFVRKLIDTMTGIYLERTITKNVNFGIIYGMSLNALALFLGISKDEAKKLLDSYHKAIPYARSTMEACADEVHRHGHVRTILNRVSDFNLWGPIERTGEGKIAVSFEAACSRWGMYNIERKLTHKALNRKLQGSAADIMKLAMVMAYESGLFDESACGIPILTVHDELDFEDLNAPENEAWKELKHIMENCMGKHLKVPLIVDNDIGNTWADAH